MPHTGPISRVSSALEQRRHRDERRPVDGVSIRLGALMVFLALVFLMVLTASPSVAASGDADPGAWGGFVNVAPILFWAAVAIGVGVRVFLGRRPARPEPTVRRRRNAESPEHASAA